MKYLKLITSVVISILILSCNETLDNTKIKGENPDKIGKYFYKIFKNDNLDEFEKWMYRPEYINEYWNATRNIRKTSKPFSWGTSEYEKCVITQKGESDEYFIQIYFKDKEDNHIYWIRFLLINPENNSKYYLSAGSGYLPSIYLAN